MTTPEFSEFTYGFSLVHSFLGDRRWGIRSIPIFPNQRQEGSTFGGYDVALNLKGIVALFQFKIPQVMERRSKKDTLGGFSAPYYRAHMHFSKKHGNRQHNSLLNHERRGRIVRYSTPAFHELWVMEFLCSKRRIHDFSVFLKPSSIGKLSSGRHYVAYPMMSILPHSPTNPPPRQVLLRSNPILIDGEFGTAALMNELDQKLERHEGLVIDELTTLERQILVDAQEFDGPDFPIENIPVSEGDVSLIRRVQSLSYIHLGCIPVIFTKEPRYWD